MIATSTVALTVAVVLVIGVRLRPRAATRRVATAETPPRPPFRRPRAIDRLIGIASTRSGRIIGVVALAALVDPFLAAVATAGTIAWPPLRARVERRREAAAIEADVPDAIELLVLVVHAGLTPHQAISSLADDAPPTIRPGFAAVMARVERGHALADALGALPERLGPSLTTVADTLAIAVRHGTPIADALGQLSADVALRRRRTAETAARKLPVKLSFPLVFATLPSFVLVAIAPAILAALSSLGDTAW